MDVTPRLTCVLGHAASGKSAWAEDAVLRTGLSPVYVATAQAFDDEMSRKITDHVARRGPEWRTVEAPDDLAGACATAAAGEAWLVDCATMWLSNLMMAEVDWRGPLDAWLSAMAAAPARFFVVSNDVGGGIVPDNALARRFQRQQGAVNQRLAAAAQEVFWIRAGLPQRLK